MSNTDRVAAIRVALAAREDHGSTHWEGCDTYHWSCAATVLLAEIDRLQVAHDLLRRSLEMLAVQLKEQP